jgi:hypothetical protein
MESQIDPLRKRQKDCHSWDESSLQEQIVFDDGLSYLEDICRQGSLFALDALPAPGSVCCSDGTQCQSFDQEKKRGEPVAVFNLSFDFPFLTRDVLDYSFLTASDGPNESPWLGTSSSWQTHECLLQSYSQEILPSAPSKENRRVDLNIPNPFAEDSANRHPCIRRRAIVLPQDGTVDGYVKVRFRNTDSRAASDFAPNPSTFCQNTMAVHHRSPPNVPGGKANIPRLPRDFGSAVKLDPLDSKLFKFCEHFANLSVAVSPHC